MEDSRSLFKILISPKYVLKGLNKVFSDGNGPLVALSNFPEGGIWPSVQNVIIPKEARSKGEREASLVVQWLRLCTLDAGSHVQSLVRELDPTCCNSDLVKTSNFLFFFKVKERDQGLY